MEKIKNARLWTLLFACLLLVGMLVPMAGDAATRVTVETESTKADPWSYNSSSGWASFLSPWHYIVNGSGNSDQVGYCLNHKLASPNSNDVYTHFDPSAYFSQRTLAGLQIIMEMGYCRTAN